MPAPTMAHTVVCACLQDDARTELLQMSGPQLADVARWCNRYPDIQMEQSLPGGTSYSPGDNVDLVVELLRSQEGELPPVDAGR